MFTSIKSRLYWVVASTVLGTLILSGVSHWASQRSHGQLAFVTANSLPSAVALGDVAEAILALRLGTEQAVHDVETGASLPWPEHRSTHDAAALALADALARYQMLPMSEAERLPWADLSAQLTTLREADAAVWGALDAHDGSTARERLVSREVAYRGAVAAAARMETLQHDLADAALAEAAELRVQSEMFVLFVAALAILTAALGARQFVAAVTGPVAELKRVADALARGEFEVPLGEVRADEFGALKGALAAALARLRDLAGAAERVSRGDGRVRLELRGERDAIGQSVNLIAARIQQSADLVRRVAQGELDQEVVPLGPEDELGFALALTVGRLRSVAVAADRLAQGDLDTQISEAGAGDRLATSVNTLVRTLRDISAQAVRIGTGDYSADIAPRSDVDVLGRALRSMTRALREASTETESAAWLRSGVASLNTTVLGQTDLQALTSAAVAALARHLGAKVGTLYVLDSDAQGPVLRLIASYAYAQRKNVASRFRLGEGLVGQVALERGTITVEQAPEDYVRVVSGLGEAPPRNLIVVPLLYKDDLQGVIEFGTMQPVTPLQRQFLEQAAGIVGVALELVAGQELRRKQQEELAATNEELVTQARALERASQELQAQQTELEQANAELEAQMQRTQDSEGRLRVQQRELAVTNEELEDRNRELERQKAEVERSRRDLTARAEELALASKYKSEFLANMSHELRTPLNSLLLLARSLRDNAEGNLTDEQRESASVIYGSGNDLLNLLNDILDLSKIEAGRMDLRLERVDVEQVAQALVRQFGHMARSLNLGFTVRVDEALPAQLVTDPARLGQILKNLVGNALKFTEAGSVAVTLGWAGPEERLLRVEHQPTRLLAIRVTDTGIGIARDKQSIVFEAFQQADSGDRRKYGGTGLGLSISRELAALLGGEIFLRSEPGVGSTFTVLVPFVDQLPSGAAEVVVARAPPAPPVESAAVPLAPVSIADDRDILQDNDRSILVIEDDAAFARVLLGEVRRRSLRGLVALRGGEGLELARAYRPSGVLLDLQLPDTSGWAVLAALKQDVDTRHIPVHIVSAEDATLEGLRVGAIGHARKPLRPEDVDTILATIEQSSASAEKWVLVVEDDPIMRKETVRIIGNGNVHAEEVSTGADALAALRRRTFALVVLDLGLPDMQGIELLEVASREGLPMPPVIVYTVRDLTVPEQLAIRNYADSIIIKDVRSQERLIDEVALFLHRVVSDLPEEKRRTIQHIYHSDEPLRGRSVLIVEDDMRTMFAMSKLLASHGINPLKAANGEQALQVLAATPAVDLVLLDMMMPVMDGYETARHIRKDPRFANLPVLALTAKAMKEDRQKCIDAGASDYLPKPVDPDRLMSLLRVWMGR